MAGWKSLTYSFPIFGLFIPDRVSITQQSDQLLEKVALTHCIDLNAFVPFVVTPFVRLFIDIRSELLYSILSETHIVLQNRTFKAERYT